MNLHINLDSSHPAYEWLESQADKIGAKGHFGTHIDCYTKTPTQNKYNLAVIIVDCIDRMVTKQSAEILPSLEGKALILHTGNMYENEYGSKEYFNEKDTSISEDTLRIILSKKPELILIDSYGIGSHGKNHVELDKLCEASGCFVIENICLVPHQVNNIERIQVVFDLEYPSTGKPCVVVQI